MFDEPNEFPAVIAPPVPSVDDLLAILEVRLVTSVAVLEFDWHTNEEPKNPYTVPNKSGKKRKATTKKRGTLAAEQQKVMAAAELEMDNSLAGIGNGGRGGRGRVLVLVELGLL